MPPLDAMQEGPNSGRLFLELIEHHRNGPGAGFDVNNFLTDGNLDLSKVNPGLLGGLAPGVQQQFQNAGVLGSNLLGPQLAPGFQAPITAQDEISSGIISSGLKANPRRRGRRGGVRTSK